MNVFFVNEFSITFLYVSSSDLFGVSKMINTMINYYELKNTNRVIYKINYQKHFLYMPYTMN